MNFGQYARRKRESAGLSQNTVARAMGYAHRANVHKLEAGELEWKLSQVLALAALLGLKVSELLAEWEQEPPQGQE